MDINMKASQGKAQRSEKTPAPPLVKVGDGYVEVLYTILSTFI